MGMSEGTKTLPTISIFDLANKKRLASVNLSMDIRNATHGLEVWPYERLLDS